MLTKVKVMAQHALTVNYPLLVAMWEVRTRSPTTDTCSKQRHRVHGRDGEIAFL